MDTSDRHREMEGRIQQHVASIKWIPLTITPVVLLGAGYGGTAAGIDLANQEFGTSFRVVLVVDSNLASIKSHRLHFPLIPDLHWEFSSQKATLDAIDSKFNRSRWEHSVWCATVASNSADSSEIKTLVARTHWMLKLLHRAKPKRFIVEQLVRVAPYLIANAPNTRLSTSTTTTTLLFFAVALSVPAIRLDLRNTVDLVRHL